jgi:hypothetical protein
MLETTAGRRSPWVAALPTTYAYNDETSNEYILNEELRIVDHFFHISSFSNNTQILALLFALEAIAVAAAAAVDEKMALSGEAVKVPYVLEVFARSAVRDLLTVVLVVVLIIFQTVT